MVLTRDPRDPFTLSTHLIHDPLTHFLLWYRGQPELGWSGRQ